MNSDRWWRQRTAAAHAALANSYTHGLGPLARVEPRLEAALRDVLARPGSLVRAVVAYLVGVEMGMLD